MKIGLLVTSVGNFGKKGFYNSQEVGLAKALEKYAEKVEVYKLVPSEEKETVEFISDTKRSTIHFVPSRHFGINGIINCSVLNKELDALIYFADTQLCVPTVYRWCKKNQIKFYPYIGTIESHSTNQIKKIIINTLFQRNLRVFKRSRCFCKTPQVEKQLEALGIRKTGVAPVGLDTDLLKKDYEKYDSNVLKEKYGYSADDKIIVFIGRFIEEKQPLDAVNLIRQLVRKNSHYHLLMVGSGPMDQEVAEAIKESGAADHIKIISSIPNTDIWELYRLAEVFLNLNRHEIFGMAILEAMYYGCKVVANSAPGPSFIIEHKISGFLCENEKEIFEAVEEGMIDPQKAHERISQKFIWDVTAKKMIEILR